MALHPTETDRTLLAFMAEHRLVLERQLESLLGSRHGGLRRRLARLAAAGFVRSGCVFGQPHHQICRQGLLAIDSQLPLPRFNLGAFKHDVGVAWLWLAARRGTFGAVGELVGERALRSHDGAFNRPDDVYGLHLGGFDRSGQPRLHYPDLLLIDRGGSRLALELELSAKGRTRRESIIAAYAADARIDRVLYLVEANPVGRRIKGLIETSARQLATADHVHVQLVTPIRLGGEEPRRRSPVRTRQPAEVAR